MGNRYILFISVSWLAGNDVCLGVQKPGVHCKGRALGPWWVCGDGIKWGQFTFFFHRTLVPSSSLQIACAPSTFSTLGYLRFYLSILTITIIYLKHKKTNEDFLCTASLRVQPGVFAVKKILTFIHIPFWPVNYLTDYRLTSAGPVSIHLTFMNFISPVSKINDNW